MGLLGSEVMDTVVDGFKYLVLPSVKISNIGRLYKEDEEVTLEGNDEMITSGEQESGYATYIANEDYEEEDPCEVVEEELSEEENFAVLSIIAIYKEQFLYDMIEEINCLDGIYGEESFNPYRAEVAI